MYDAIFLLHTLDVSKFTWLVKINKCGPAAIGNANTTQNLIIWNPLLKLKDVDSEARQTEIN